MSDVVERYYDEICEDEWNRLVRHRLEFEMTKALLLPKLPHGAAVLDVGGGPGRYSIWLAGLGHDVTLVDLSAQNVRQAQQEAAAAGVSIRALHGNALALGALPLGQYDAVLCMGPLYHLNEEAQRALAMEQCLDRLKPGGLLAASFISAFAPIIDALKKYPHIIDEYDARFRQWLRNGRGLASGGSCTDAYYIRPEEARAFMEGFGLRDGTLYATECLGAAGEAALMALPAEQFERWVSLLATIAAETTVLGCCEHLLYMGHKAN